MAARLGAIVALATALLTAAGFLSQFIAYIAAREFYLYFGLEPAQVGITPFNAALKLTFTWRILLIETLPTVVTLLLLAVLFEIGRQLSRYVEKEVPSREERRVELASAMSVAYTDYERLETSAQWRRNETLLNVSRAVVNARTARLVVRLLVLMVVFVGFIDSTTRIDPTYERVIDAGKATARAVAVTKDVEGDALTQAVGVDLNPPIVTFQWAGPPQRRPIGLDEPVVPGVDIYQGRLIASTNGQFIIYQISSRAIYTFQYADVVVSSYAIGLR